MRCFFFFQAEDGIRDLTVTGGSDVCSSDLSCEPRSIARDRLADAQPRISIRRTELIALSTWRVSLRVNSSSPHDSPHRDRKSTRLNSSHSQISYAVFCLKKKKD